MNLVQPVRDLSRHKDSSQLLLFEHLLLLAQIISALVSV